MVPLNLFPKSTGKFNIMYKIVIDWISLDYDYNEANSNWLELDYII